MPILNIQLVAQDPSGNQIPPLVALQQRGPIVQVSVSVEQNIAQQLLAQRIPLPTIDVVTIASASRASTQQNVHPIQIEVIGLPTTISAPRAIAAPLAAQGLIVLIGRDVLQHCTLFYNGLAGGLLVVGVGPLGDKPPNNRLEWPGLAGRATPLR